MGIVISFGTINIDSDDGVKTIHCESSKDTYSSFENPIGTAYMIPENKILKVGLAQFSGDAVKTKICIGYGDDVVNDSITPPTNNVELIHQLPVEIANKLYSAELYLKMPGNKYPYIHATDGFGSILLIVQEY